MFVPNLFIDSMAWVLTTQILGPEDIIEPNKRQTSGSAEYKDGIADGELVNRGLKYEDNAYSCDETR